MAKSNNTKIIVGVAGGAALLLFAGRKQVMLIANMAFDAAKAQLFKQVIPTRSRRFADALLRVAAEDSLNPFLLVALMERESGSGEYLSPRGPEGTGDGGHGRGLFQIDDRTNGNWLLVNNWHDPYVNAKKGSELLRSKLKELGTRVGLGKVTANGKVYLSSDSAKRRGVSAPSTGIWLPDPRPLSGEKLFRGAVAAYNTGSYNVLMSVAAGLDPDHTTTPGPTKKPDYSADVVKRAAQWASAFEAVGGGKVA